MTLQTCPAARNALTRLRGEASRAVMAGGTSTCETSIEKFGIEKFERPSCLAWKMAMALAGAVVSKPTPKNTT